MKVLFIISTFPKLSETFILNQMTGLIDAGIEVEILAWNQVFNEKEHKEVESYHLLEKTTFIDLPSNKGARLRKAIVLFFKMLLTHPFLLKETLNGRKYGQIAYSLRLLFSLPYFLNRKSSDAVICHYGPNGNIAAFYKKNRLLKERTMVFFHGQDVTAFVKKWGEEVYRPLFAQKIELLPVSHFFAKKLTALGAKQEQIDVHRMGIHLGKIEFVRSIEKKRQQIKLLSIGRLTEKKGMDTVIKMMSCLKKASCISVQLTIIGGGGLQQELEDLSKQLEVANDIIFAGYKTQSEIDAAIFEADLLVQLSRTAESGDMEGIPMVLMEAMARGILVLSTKHSGIPELVKHNETGFLVPENAPKEAADEVIRIFSGEVARDKISYQARQEIERNFNLEKWNEKLVKRIKVTREDSGFEKN
ncbi:glycosyltransferase [Listeria aquatica]|uniref:Glycosyltransferase n=1 Tax=Listeria aquatica TaxID=1494960 RepID=A0A841ZM72_9LIST|nr:glycosyltransferase [Listeria aquatica]MBC1520285.1 glycosyltransferase [Listeria aquatica]